MSFYSAWGFSEPPFQTTALPPTEKGSELLVGRDRQIQTIFRRLTTPPKLVTVEGVNGVGKTSLVNVATFRAFQQYLKGQVTELFIPTGRPFQLTPNKSSEELVQEVALEVAQTLVRNAEHVKSMPKLPNHDALDKWLNSPLLGTVGGSLGASLFGFGGTVGGTRAEAANTAEGFRSSGMLALVRSWLAEIFPDWHSGGVVCIIDNLELLQTSEAARAQLEVLRDELFAIQGLRWVLCGALGIVQGVASSPRLEGMLHNPVELSGIDDAHAVQILPSRVAAFKVADPPYLPLDPPIFVSLYDLLRGNLRATLSHADNYCQWLLDMGIALPTTPTEKRMRFDEWLQTETRKYYDAALSQITPRAWQVFDTAVVQGGAFSPSDYEAFGFNTVQALRPHVRDLEEMGLLVSAREDGDRRRKTVQVTPKGWFVAHARAQHRG